MNPTATTNRVRETDIRFKILCDHGTHLLLTAYLKTSGEYLGKMDAYRLPENPDVFKVFPNQILPRSIRFADFPMKVYRHEMMWED